MEKEMKFVFLFLLIFISFVVATSSIHSVSAAPPGPPSEDTCIFSNGGIELCNDSIDNDCNGFVDDGCDVNNNETVDYCGDAICNSDETCSTCSVDCGVCITSSGGGGGGGGRNVGSSSSSDNNGVVVPDLEFLSDDASQQFVHINNGDETIFETKDGSLTVVSIGFKAIKDLSNVDLAITESNFTPITIKSKVGETYKYLKVKKNDLVNTDIDSTKIEFKVSKTWITDNGYSSDELALFKYMNNEWVEMPTEILTESSDEVFFSSETPGFSYFVVGIKDSVLGIGTDNAAKTRNINTPKFWAWFLFALGAVIVLAIIILIIILIIRKRKRKVWKNFI